MADDVLADAAAKEFMPGRRRPPCRSVRREERLRTERRTSVVDGEVVLEVPGRRRIMGAVLEQEDRAVVYRVFDCPFDRGG